MRGHWTPFEDEKLKQLVSLHGPHNWNHIAQQLPGRSGKSCRLRWFNQLDPRINRQAFSKAEEERLVAAHRLYGNKWALIARLFPGRTDNAVKNQWHVISARRLRNSKLNNNNSNVGNTSMSSSTTKTSTSSSPLLSKLSNLDHLNHQYIQHQHRLFRDKIQLPNLHTTPPSIKTSFVTSKPTIFNISPNNIPQPITLSIQPSPSNHSSSLDHDPSISSTSTSTSTGIAFSNHTQHSEDLTQLSTHSTTSLQHDQHKHVPFIDFLGVGSV